MIAAFKSILDNTLKNTSFQVYGPIFLNILLFIVLLVFSFNLEWDNSLWGNLGDPYDYWHQSRFSIFSSDAYFPEATPGYYPRPFIVPILYNIAGGEPEHFIPLQILLHGISALCIGFAVIIALKKTVVKFFFLISWYLLTAWWNIAGWDLMVLSESISTALFFIWFSSLVIFHLKMNWKTFGLHVFVTFWFCLSRDHWPTVLLIFYSLYALVQIYLNRAHFKYVLPLIGYILILLIFQQKSSDAGNRHYLPMMNNMGLRIAKNTEHLNWFKNEGMPGTDIIANRYNALTEDASLIAFYNDPGLEAFRNWVKDQGKITFVKFLISHPFETLLIHEKKDERKRIFAYNLPETHGEKIRLSPMSDAIFPLFNLNIILVLIVLLCVLYYFERSRFLLLCLFIPLILFLHIIASYNGDAVEIERHLVLSNILLQFIGVLALTIMLDSKLVTNQLFKINTLVVRKTKPVTNSD